MNEFPEFMRNDANAIDSGSQSRGVEGYVFDGIDNSQMAFWTCHRDGESQEHVHEYDEYMIVVQGQYDVIFRDSTTEVKAGQEIFIPKDVPHAGRFSKGTRTIHAFGGKRASRK
jgi:quercetin dioxygenase-like cupin family protein